MKVEKSFCCDVIESSLGKYRKYRRMIHPDGTLQWQGKRYHIWLSVGSSLSETLEQEYKSLNDE